jgi:hypothetical protein
MTREERLDLIERLQVDNDESRERAEERRRQREADPLKMNDFIMAAAMVATKDAGDLHFTQPVETPRSEPLGALYVRQIDGPPENAAAHAARADTVPSDVEDWRDEVARSMAEVVIATRRELRAEYAKALAMRDRRITKLEAQNTLLRGKLDDALKKIESVAAEVDAGHKDRDALVASFQVEVAELRGRMGAILRDFVG